MYRKTSEQGNFIERVGSHSTKPRASGRVDVLPPEARPTEQLYAGIREQFIAVDRQWATLKQEWTITRNPATKKELRDRWTVLGHHRRQLLDAMSAAATNAFAETFYFVARQMLTTELFGRIYEETECLIGRPRIEWTGAGRKAGGGHETIRETDQPRFRQVEDKD